MGNMWDMMKQMRGVQDNLKSLQDELKSERVEGSSGGGMVTAVMDGQQNLIALNIDPSIVDADDTEMLEELVVAAMNQTRTQAQTLSQERLSGLLPPGLAWLDLGSLGI